MMVRVEVGDDPLPDILEIEFPIKPPNESSKRDQKLRQRGMNVHEEFLPYILCSETSEMNFIKPVVRVHSHQFSLSFYLSLPFHMEGKREGNLHD